MVQLLERGERRVLILSTSLPNLLKRSSGSWFIFVVNTYLKSYLLEGVEVLQAPALISGLRVGHLQSTVSEEGPCEFHCSRPVASTIPATRMQILKHKNLCLPVLSLLLENVGLKRQTGDLKEYELDRWLNIGLTGRASLCIEKNTFGFGVAKYLCGNLHRHPQHLGRVDVVECYFRAHL